MNTVVDPSGISNVSLSLRELPHERVVHGPKRGCDRRSGWEFVSRAERTSRSRELADQGFLIARVVSPAVHGTGIDRLGGDRLGGDRLGGDRLGVERLGVDQFGAALPGRLDEAIRGAVEISMALRGLAPCRAPQDAGSAETTKLELARLEMVGANGLCIVMPELRQLARATMKLDAQDSATLCEWRELAETAHVIVLLDADDRHIEVQAPIALDRLFAEHGQESAAPAWPDLEGAPSMWPGEQRALGDADERVFNMHRESVPASAVPLNPVPDTAVPRIAAPESAVAASAVAASAVPRSAVSGTRPGDEWDVEQSADAEDVANGHSADDALSACRNEIPPPPPSVSDRATERPMECVASAATHHGKSSEEVPDARPTLPDVVRQVMRHDPLAGLEEDLDLDGYAARAEHALFASPVLDHPMALPVAGMSDASAGAQKQARRVTAPLERGDAHPRVTQSLGRPRQAQFFDADGDGPREFRRRNGRSIEVGDAAVSRPLPTFDGAKLRAHATTLLAATGPRPVKQIEQLFVEHYVPLSEALLSGYEDKDGDTAVMTWRASFEKSYRDSFTAMRVSGKRPRMVLDAPELAAQVGRLHGARSVQLVLVDGLRYDLAQRVTTRLKERLGARATLVEETVIWSALPTVTPVQLKLLAQGAAGLRELDPASDREPTVRRDGSVTTLRRERIGRRDLLKLDVVEARLRESGAGFDARMHELSIEVAVAVEKLVHELPARTLLYVFGDHGFSIRSQGNDRTSHAEQGGAKPEETLVCGAAWLVGELH